MVEFRILGPLEVSDGAVTAKLGGPKQRALLAILLIHAGEIVPVEALIDPLWGAHPPRTAAHSIQIYVSNLRRALEPVGAAEALETRPPGYLLDVGPGALDANRFEVLVREGTDLLAAGDFEESRSRLHEAIGLWRGPALSDFVYEEFAQPHIRRLNERRIDAIETLAAAELEAGRLVDAMPLLTTAVREEPLRERTHELLMMALYRSGRHAEALRTFDALRTRLGDELGVDPSPAIRNLYDRVLLHDPSLLGEAAASDRVELRNPYKGLRPFTEDDAADFFGRDALIRRLEDALADGQRLVSLVGPSGSGKSSVVAAGLVPRLRAGTVPGSARWRVTQMVPGSDRLRQAIATVRRASGREDESPDLRSADGQGTTVLVIDQFEQVFGGSDQASRDELLTALAAAVATPESGLRVILTMRADFYDRPLLHPEFAAVFGPSVVNVIPMSAQELEEAIVEPARRGGVDIEAGLLAELIGDTLDRPASLPLLQYALTELFEQRTGSVLTRASYQSLGGLAGMLTRRAESLYRGLDPEAQSAAMPVFLRLVRVTDGMADARRAATLGELSDLGLDPVALSEVLTTFGRHRLLTFARDTASGRATVEVAHEALLGEWERLAGWIEEHRAILRLQHTLSAAADEWELAERNPDYLLTGSRLEPFESWTDGDPLPLSGREQTFLRTALERRHAAEESEARRAALQRSARRQQFALGVTAVLLGAGLVYAILVGIGPPTTRVALLADSAGGVVGQIVSSAFDRAVTDFQLAGAKIDTRELGNQEAYLDELRRASRESSLVIVFDIVPFETVAREHPDTLYLVFNYGVGSEPNVQYVVFKEWEGSFLAGVAAARTTTTGAIGFIGGQDTPLIWGFQAGYVAGARAADQDVTVHTSYLADDPDDFSGFLDPSGARAEAERMYGEGVDVIFHVAGSAGLGVFQAASQQSATQGRHLWAIGVDSDQYESVRLLPGAADAASWQPHILTSMVKRFDLAVTDALEEIASGRFTPGMNILDLANRGVDISYSGGFIDGVREEIERYRDQIASGALAVPCVPPDRAERAEAFALEEAGMTLEDLMGTFGCGPVEATP